MILKLWQSTRIPALAKRSSESCRNSCLLIMPDTSVSAVLNSMSAVSRDGGLIGAF